MNTQELETIIETINAVRELDRSHRKLMEKQLEELENEVLHLKLNGREKRKEKSGVA